MKRKKLLLATAALTTAISCGGKKKTEPVIYGNPKGGHYDPGLADAGVDAPPPAPDAGAADIGAPKQPDPEIYANTKGSFYDDGLVTKPGT
jgi:hypothetical protein